ncbi:hypothetical protein [Ruminococcus flavefaciens]|uniref:hypothetical protein n=1 Tax=Ruminococcus flavefaciens TaxID=1265 RepID=UPI003EFBB257
MGYNFFNIKEVSGVFDRKLNDFRASLEAAVCNGKSIPFADNDITYILKLQHDRLSKKGLEISYDIYSRDDNKNKFIAGSSWKDAHYESTVCFNQSGIKRKVKQNGMIKYKDDRKSVLYETITDVVNGIHPDNDTYCCPNCGAVSTVSGLQNGCSYCGTRFQMDDLFPKVTSYYFIDTFGMTKKEFLSGYLTSFIIMLIAVYILGIIFSKGSGYYIGFTILSIFIAYFLYAYFLFMKMIVRVISSAGKMGTAGSRRKFETRMKKISPEFSYEYFTSKTLSLIKTAVFSENENELLFYKGGKLDPKMKDIIDMNYGGALGCKSIHEEGSFVTVETKAYFDVLYASNDKVFFKKQVFSATLKRRTDIPVNFNFSMTKIGCPSCGASFDATKNKTCPYCGNKYEITTDDWALVELKYN